MAIPSCQPLISFWAWTHHYSHSYTLVHYTEKCPDTSSQKLKEKKEVETHHDYALFKCISGYFFALNMRIITAKKNC